MFLERNVSSGTSSFGTEFFSRRITSAQDVGFITYKKVFGTCMTTFHSCFTIGPKLLFISFYQSVPWL